MRRLCFGMTLLLTVVMQMHNLQADEPFYLGQRANDDLPQLTDEELGSAQQQALLQALNGDAYGHRGGDHAQAGCAMLIRRFAIPSNTAHYGYYRVGGGVPILGDAPMLDEGTFGWDYSGILFNKRVALTWTHGRKFQGGTLGYKPDGPRHLRR
jgi:hypothetical protein